MKQIKLLQLITLILFSPNIYAQSNNNVSGGSLTIGGQTYEYSIGEMALVNTFSSSSIVVTQGILQPIVNTETGIVNTSILPNELIVFPNPFNDIITVKPSMNARGKLSITLFDVSGRQINNYDWQLINGDEQNAINLNRLAAGSYMLMVRFTNDKTNAFTTFKIQKVN